MKTKIYSLLVALMSVVTFSACDDWTPGEQGAYLANTGGVSRAKMDVAVNDEVTAIGRAVIDTSGFLVTVTEKGSDNIAVYDGKPCSWTYSSMPQIFTLPVGEYTVKVRSHEPADAAWSAPYYEGSADFTVKNNDVTYIGTVTCNFASIKVEISFSDELAKAMSDDSKVDVVAGVAGTSLTWTAGETRYGYFYPAEDNPTIIATFTGNVKGQIVSATKNVTDAKRGNYYIFSFSLNSGNPILPDEFGDITGGDTGINIDFEVIESNINSSVKPGDETPANPDTHPDNEEWPEEPTPPGPDNPDEPKAIEMIPNGIDLDGINQAIKGNTYEMTFKSKTPITNIKVEIISDYLTEAFLSGVGLTTKFDLADPQEYKEGLEGLGFKTGNDIIGKTEVPFVLTELIPLLNADPKIEIHTFRVTIKAEENNEYTRELKFQNTK